MNDIIKEIRDRLFSLQDPGYKAFHCRLMPNVNPETVIGVRIPELRKFAKELSKLPEAEIFLKALPHKYYEENNLHGYLIENIKDYYQAVKAVDTFLPYVDNWATCDTMSPKIFGKYTEELYEKIKEWAASSHAYTVRFGIGMLMKFFLDDKFDAEHLELVAKTADTPFEGDDRYYVDMMASWYFATALSKQYEHTLKYMENKNLDKWVHNKAIQKATESRRLTEMQKKYLRTLKIK